MQGTGSLAQDVANGRRLFCMCSTTLVVLQLMFRLQILLLHPTVARRESCFKSVKGSSEQSTCSLNRARTVSSAFTFGMLGPAELHLQSLVNVACSTGVADRGVWLRISRQFLSCALLRGRCSPSPPLP